MSEIKVNKITPRTGTTITLGDSGDSLSIASGVALTDFTSTGIDDNATSTALTINSSGNIGIGTSSINSKLDVRGTGAITLNVGSTDGTSARLTLDATNGDASGGDFPLLLSDGSDLLIEANNSTSDAEIRFRNNGSDAIRIDSSGNVGIGTSSPSAVLDVRDETNGANFIVGGSGTTNITKIGGGAGDSVTVYSNSTTPVATFSTSGNTLLEGSLYLGGETSSANALDDYEEGTWTASYGTSGTNTGYYTKVGRLVTLNIIITGTSQTFDQITGLPFSSDLATGSVTFGRLLSVGAGKDRSNVGGNTSGSILYLYNENATSSSLTTGSGTVRLDITVSYLTNA